MRRGRDVLRAVSDLLRAHYDASKSFLEPKTIVFAAPWLFRDGDRVANRFSIVKRIARGGMGEVYQVYDERLRLHVALKAIRPELIGDAETAERFRREVLVTRDIAHEGLCRVFDLVEHEVTTDSSLPPGTVIPCLTMQLLEGNSLQERLESSGPLSPAEALPLVQQIADALEVLHGAGVVHRDLKPSNVMLVPTAEGTRAVLTDFGLAKPLDESIFETRSHVQGGAPYFMAPELLKGDRPSHASDIYAFGLLIDEMVTSTRAFASESLHTLMLQKLGDGPARRAIRAIDLPVMGTGDPALPFTQPAAPLFERRNAVYTALMAPERPGRRGTGGFLRRTSSEGSPTLAGRRLHGDDGGPASAARPADGESRTGHDAQVCCHRAVREPDEQAGVRLPGDWNRGRARPPPQSGARAARLPQARSGGADQGKRTLVRHSRFMATFEEVNTTLRITVPVTDARRGKIF